ncbi:GNAT family N-acetyltransferase [Streptomyces luteireticuli]|uniref:GNAT family N-acetyltransferase n=1 Tax=Streptomyces luteireticuli TaxID=173858 RepID=UPI003555CD07
MAHPLRLIGDKVVVREFHPDDVEDMQRVFGDDRVTAWLSFDSRDLDETRVRIEKAIENARAVPRTEFYLAVTTLDDEAHPIGFVRLVRSGSRGEEIGCAIAADEWGRGYGDDAHRVLLDFAFGELELERVAGWIPLANTKRMKALDENGALGRLGFVPDRVAPRYVFINGTWWDCMLNSVTAEEWRRRSR